MHRVIVESSARAPGTEPDDYSVDLTCEIRRVVAVRLAWTVVPAESPGAVGPGNDALAFRWASGRREDVRLAPGRVADFAGVLALAQAAAPVGVAVARAADADVLVFSSTDGDPLALVGATSSARRLVGLPCPGTTPSAPALEARMPHEPDLSPDPYLHMFVDAMGGPAATSNQETAGSCACVPPGGFTEYAREWIGAPAAGALRRLRVRFERPGGFRHDFRGRDHAFALDVATR